MNTHPYQNNSAEKIYASLQHDIIDLTLEPGSRLSENSLCERFGVTRTMIRGILQRLQENGLVRIIPYKGTEVTLLNFEIVDDLIYERTAVEGRILRDFCEKCTPELLGQIERQTEVYSVLAREESPDFNRVYQADCRLHEIWFRTMNKMYLWNQLQNAHADYSRFRMLDTIASSGLHEVIEDHYDILHALQSRDVSAFEPLIEHHLYGGIRRLGSRITSDYGHYFLPTK